MKVCVFNDMSYVTNNRHKQSIQTAFTDVCQQQLTVLKSPLKASSPWYSGSREFSSSQGAYSSNDVCEGAPSTHDNAEITEFLWSGLGTILFSKWLLPHPSIS